MDFCIGTVVFVLLGFSLMMAEDYAFGLIGIPNLDIFTDFADLSRKMLQNLYLTLCSAQQQRPLFQGNGGAYKVRFLLYLFGRHFPLCLSGRGRMDLESPGMACTAWVP